MRLADLSPFFARNLSLLQNYAQAPSLWRNLAADTAAAHERDNLSHDDAMQVLHDAQRIIRVFESHLQNDEKFMAAVTGLAPRMWRDFTSPPASDELQQSLAARIYNITSRDDVAWMEVGDTARRIGVFLFEKCIAGGAAFDVQFVDPVFNTLAMNMAPDDGIAGYAHYLRDRRITMTKRMHVSYNLPTFVVPETDRARQRVHDDIFKPVRMRLGSGLCHFTLTSIPTTRDAEVDGIAYDDYINLFFEACDQPWEEIKQAQYRLIETLDKTVLLRFTNSDGTDLSMNVDGFTFCNSVIARNIPGSEVFSAPHIDSTQGTIVARGKFALKDGSGQVGEDLVLQFDKGKLIGIDARVGLDEIERIISIDEGARRIGEIGIGTNPRLKQHVASILLAEKIGGSFHVALGDAYTMTDYMGDKVHVDNGNRSHLHWDITTMLHGRQGRIYADGNIIMENGIFTDPALDVLNRGWAAIPVENRPAYWRRA